MLPGVRPCTIRGHIADAIIADFLTVILRQQLVPRLIIVLVLNGIYGCSKLTCGVGVFSFREDITCGIIGVDPCLTGCLIVFS